MIVTHNMAAMNAQRMFGINVKAKTKSAEKLSSGYKVNRAADNAAGLAISEKMRRQIRGLNQGAENIQDGISLVQVADGALNEITECMQRMNELSIKAYNDTNQQTDREYIQCEIEQLIAEIENITETTTFNEIPILQGNPTQLVKAKDVEGYVITDYETEIPSWLKVSATLDQANSADLTSYYQETGMNAVFQVSPGIYNYYGLPNDEYDALGYNYQGDWSQELTDNASAIIDFSGLADVTSASDLYNNLFQLIGTSIGVPCGTCTEYYGISFTGSEMGLEVEDGVTKYSNGATASDSYLNLSNWKAYADEDMTVFDKVKELIINQAADDSKTDAEKENEVKQLAAEIAEKLSQESFRLISDTMAKADHFDRVLRTDDGKIVIYDFRDVQALANANSADAMVQTSSTARAKVPASFFDENEYIEVTKPIIIQCSAQVEDEIPIDLPSINMDSLGIRGYNVASYTQKTVYSNEYQEKLSEWERTGCHYETVTETIPATPETTTMVSVRYFDFNENGEPIVKYKQVEKTVAAVPERTIQKQVLVEDTPKPQPGEGDVYTEYTYVPDDVSIIKDAISYINKCRAKLGATQNRLEHTYNNNLNISENTTAAESRIRDTDMAREMVTYSNLSILEQVGHAMMAQANQSHQGVLNLIQ